MTNPREDFLEAMLGLLLQKYGVEVTLAELHYALMNHAIGDKTDKVTNAARDIWEARERYKRQEEREM